MGRSKFQKFQILKACQAKTSIATYGVHTESLETPLLHGGVSSLIGTDSTSESGTERNYVIQFIAEDKRQVLEIVKSVENSFRKSAVKSLKQSHKKLAVKLSLKRGHKKLAVKLWQAKK